MKKKSLIIASICLSVAVVSAAELAVFDFAQAASFQPTRIATGVSSISLTPQGSKGVSAISNPTVGGQIENGTYLFHANRLFVDRGGWMTWGNTAVSQAGPFTLTVTAKRDFDLLVEALSIDVEGNAGAFKSDFNFFMAISEKGGSAAEQGSISAERTGVVTSKFASPVTIVAGTSQTFNIRINTGPGPGAGLSQHILSAITLQGTARRTSESRAALQPQAARQSRPNLLFLLSDDHATSAMGAYGNTTIQTPNLDRLAGEGTRFTRAYVTTPVCAVARGTILTGQYARSSGIEDFHHAFSDAQLENIYPSVLQRSGYYTGFIGKWGVAANNRDFVRKSAETFDFWAGDTHQTNFWHGADCNYVLNNGPTNTCDCPPDSSGKAGSDVRVGKENIENPLQLTVDVIPEKVRSFLEGRDRSKPFNLSISYKAPHGPWQDYPDALEELYKNVRIPAPASARESYILSEPGFFDETLESDRGSRMARVAHDDSLNNEFHSLLRHYYRLITALDQSIGSVREILKEYGVDEDTVIIYMSDNGHLEGEHGLFGKWLMYEESISVPAIYYDPRIAPQNVRALSDEMIMSIDIAPTLLELAGVDIPEQVQGASIVPLTSAGHEAVQTSWRSTAYFEHHAVPHRIVESEAVIAGDWKYVVYTESDPIFEQLFNLKEEPLEVRNYSTDPEKREVLIEMRARYKEYLEHLPKADQSG